LPNTEGLELIITFATYIFFIVTFMYRIDERFYFIVKRFVLYLFGTDTSWIFSTRYQKITNYENILDNLYDELIKYNCTLNKREKSYLSVFWQSRNAFNFRIEKTDYDEYSLIFFTSTIDISFRNMRKKIIEISNVYEKIENKLNMVDRNEKIYEIEIIYNDSSPYYSFLMKTLPNEKIVKFDCVIRDGDSIFNVNKNSTRYRTQSLNDLFTKINKYLNLKGD
jgi:hypothetical protein